jgi:hypothetical protein
MKPVKIFSRKEQNKNFSFYLNELIDKKLEEEKKPRIKLEALDLRTSIIIDSAAANLLQPSRHDPKKDLEAFLSLHKLLSEEKAKNEEQKLKAKEAKESYFSTLEEF